MIIPEVIANVNGIYYVSENLDKLKSGIDSLNEVLLVKSINESNQKKAEALLYKITAKYLAIKYFDGGYLEEDYLTLKEKLNENIELAKTKEYAKTLKVLQDVLVVADGIHNAMAGAEGEIYRVKDENDNPMTSDQVELRAFADDFRKRANSLEQLPDTSALFGEGVKSKNIKESAIADLLYYANWAEKVIKQFDTKLSEQFLKENLTLLDDQPGQKVFEYNSANIDFSRNSAKAIVALSPFFDEIVLFARSIAKEKGINFSIINAHAFIDKSNDFIENLFKELANRKIHLIINGLSHYNAENKQELVRQALLYSKTIGETILIDDLGDRGVYNLSYEIAKNTQGLSTLDVIYKYLTMPEYNFVVTELERRGMITTLEYGFIRDNMAFMGYVGLNLALSLFVQGKQWKDDVMDISDRHQADCQLYLKRLPSQTQLIDLGWRDLNLGSNTIERKKNFDYDSIRSINVNNVKKILNANVDLFAKCGLISDYCILAGEDISSWSRIERQEKQDRVNNATKLVAHLLNCEDVPEVEIVSKEEWKKRKHPKDAGGLCINGGKKIEYREDCCDNVDWLIRAVCHECYHSFQHTLENNGWQEWHWTELGVTKNRITEWKYNSENYHNIDNYVPYMIQVVESDARAFENDCKDKVGTNRAKIDWE